MKRVLVTGGAGFISSNVIRHLLANTAHEVISLDSLTYAGNLENLADVMSHERLSFVHGDIRDAALVAELVDGVDVIVNAAAESHVEKSIEEGASEFVTTNVEGTQILLDAIRRTPVERFILISSSEVYGTAETDPMDERHPLEPRSPYAATKAGGDRLAYSYFVTYDLPIVIVRPFNNYGPRQHPEKVVPRFITQALAGAPLTIHGDGHASRDWLYVDDHAEAIEALIDTPIDAARRRGRQRRDGRRHLRRGHRRPRARRGRRHGLDQGARPRAARPGRPPHRLDGQDGRADRLARPHELRRRSRADRRLVPRERGLVAEHSRSQPARLLVLGAGAAQLGLLEAAAARDLSVIAVDRNPLAPGFAFADERAVISSEDEAGIERLAQGARGRRDHLARGRLAGRDRGAGRRAPRPAASDQRRHGGARDDEDAPARAVRRRGRRPAADVLGRAIPTITFPCVVKAPDRQGQRGLTLVREPSELAAAVETAVAESRGGGVLVEELIDGPGADGERRLVRRRVLPAHGDRQDPRRAARLRRRARPHLAERARRPRPSIEAARAAVAALGIENGPTLHADQARPRRPALRGRGRGPARRRPRRRALPRRDRRRPQRPRALVRARRQSL